MKSYCIASMTWARLCAVFFVGSVAACGAEPKAPAMPTAQAYLLGVWTLPYADEVTQAEQDTLIAFEMHLPSSTTDVAYALRPHVPGPDGHRGSALRLADGRHAWANRRRALQNQALTMVRKTSGALVSAPASSTPCTPGCDSAHTCWQGSCVTSVPLTLPDGAYAHTGASVTSVNASVVTVLSGTGATLSVLLDSQDDAQSTRTAVTAAAQRFLDTLPTELSLLSLTGHTGVIDHDGDHRLMVVFTSANGSYIPDVMRDNVGFFSADDITVAASGLPESGNNADILWVRVPGQNGHTTDEIAGTLVHEYTHLASYLQRLQLQSAMPASDLRETKWVDEALAHLMENVTGWSSCSVDTLQKSLASLGLPDFTFAGEDSIPQRGFGMMLLRHLIDTEAKAAGAQHAADSVSIAAATRLFYDLIHEDKQGFGHARLAALRDQGTAGLGPILLGIYATGAPNLEAEAHAHDFLPTAPHPLTGQVVGINPRATVTDPLGASVQLAGPSVAPLTAADGDVTGDLLLGSARLWTFEPTLADKFGLPSAISSAGPYAARYAVSTQAPP